MAFAPALIEKGAGLGEGGEFRVRVIEFAQPAHLLGRGEPEVATEKELVENRGGVAFAGDRGGIEAALGQRLGLRLGDRMEMPVPDILTYPPEDCGFADRRAETK